MILQLVEILILGQEISKILIGRERIEIGEHSITLHMARIVQVDVLWVGIHRTYLLPYILCRVREIDTVTQRLRHFLLTIGTWQTARCEVLGQHDIGLYQYRCIDLVETAHQLTGYLQHRLLVLTSRHCGSLEQGDISSL